MAQIMGKSMRFVISVPIATGRELIRASRDLGMAEYAFTSAALIIGGRSLIKSPELMDKITAVQAVKLAEFALEAGKRSPRGRPVADGLRKGKKK